MKKETKKSSLHKPARIKYHPRNQIKKTRSIELKQFLIFHASCGGFYGLFYRGHFSEFHISKFNSLLIINFTHYRKEIKELGILFVFFSFSLDNTSTRSV